MRGWLSTWPTRNPIGRSAARVRSWALTRAAGASFAIAASCSLPTARLTRRKCGIKLDRRLELPRLRDNDLRLSPQLAQEMQGLLGAMEEED